MELLIPSFIAGLFMFLAPCTLPIVPGYISFISGVALKDINDAEKFKKVRKKIIYNSLLYIAGFSFVFILLGVLFGLGGSALVKYRIWLSRIGGIFVLFFGFYMLKIFDFKFLRFLHKDFKIKLPKNLKPGRPLSSFIFGATFAFGWSPCLGPIIGSVLLLASYSSTVLEGGFLLLVFSFGLGIPFFLVALGIGWSTKHLYKINRILPYISLIGGVFVIFIGILLITDSFNIWVIYFYKLFFFIDYNKIFDFL